MSRENLTVSGMMFVVVLKSSHDHGYTGRLLDVSHLDLNEITLSTMWILIRKPSDLLSRLSIIRLVHYVLTASNRSSGRLKNS